MIVFFHKILILFIIHSLLFQQGTLAGPLPWEVPTRSASVLPYHIDGGRMRVLLSEKTYEDPTHGRTFWSDFGGDSKEGEPPAQTASRELKEETLGMIQATPKDLLNCPLHQIDMKNSPFSSTRETFQHTIFFKEMANRDTPILPTEAPRTPQKDGSGEVSRYAWVLVDDLLNLQAPSLFGRVIGKHFPDEFRDLALENASEVACLLAPFFVVLQQTSVKSFLRKTQERKSFSQIEFTGVGFADWRLVHSGFLTNISPFNQPKQPLQQQGLESLQVDPEEDLNLPVFSLELIHTPQIRTPSHFPYAIDSPNFWFLNPLDTTATQVSLNPLENSPTQQFIVSYTRKMRCLKELEIPPVNSKAWILKMLLRQRSWIKAWKLKNQKSLTQKLRKPQDHPLVVPPQEIPGHENSLEEMQAQWLTHWDTLSTAQKLTKCKNCPFPDPHDTFLQGENHWENLWTALLPISDAYLSYLLGDLECAQDVADKQKFIDSLFQELSIPLASDAQKTHEMAKVLRRYTERVKQLRPNADIEGMTDRTFAQSVAEVLEHERTHPEVAFAYHACRPEVAFLQIMYEALSNVLGLPKRTIHWRFFDRVPQKYPTVTGAFADTAQSEAQTQKFVNPFEVLVAANAFLFGNPGHPGCNTLIYWKDAHSETPLDLKQIIKEVLSALSVQSPDVEHTLLAIFQESYFIDEASHSGPIRRRPIGTLRQIAFCPEDAETGLHLSGWFFSTPLSFQDQELPDGQIVSIYQGLEEDDKAWLRHLTPTLRFMAHIRAGHGPQLETAISKYHALAPTGGLAFDINDCEIRVAVGEGPDWVRTHYYPPSPQDAQREEATCARITEIVRSALQGVSLPVISFHEPFCRHTALTSMLAHHLGIIVSPPVVSPAQFQSAIGQGDLKTMKAFLNTPHPTHPIFAKDLGSGKMRPFTIADYVAMISRGSDMVRAVCLSFLSAHPHLLREGTSQQGTPYALEILLNTSGLNGLQHLGWQGDLNESAFSLVFNRTYLLEPEEPDPDEERMPNIIFDNLNILDLFKSKEFLSFNWVYLTLKKRS